MSSFFYCRCGTLLENDMGAVTCPRCGMQYPESSRPDSESQYRPEDEGGTVPMQKGTPAASDEQQMTRCPECGSRLAFREGCMSCTNAACGWTACG